MKNELQTKQAALATLADRMRDVRQRVDASDSAVFGDFCRKINVSNIHEYEDDQLRLAREEGEAIEKFKIQQARLARQWVTDWSSS